MNIKRLCLSGLFSLLSGLTMTSFGSRSEAEVTSWVAGYPDIGSGGVTLSCMASSGGMDSLSWTFVTYVVVGIQTDRLAEDITIPPMGAENDITGGMYRSLSPGSYGAFATAAGVDIVTQDGWYNSTPTSPVVIP